MSTHGLVALSVGLLCLAASGRAARGGDDFERDPIRYSEAQPANAISRLQDRLDQGAASLEFDDTGRGYLPALLRALDVPVSSQVLVFSKTSLQRQRIAPHTPRAIYFNDELYIGFCRRGDVLEVSAVDPQLGAVFYTLEQKASDTPQFVRQTDNCLLCHGSSQTKSVPGHLVRSVFVDAAGSPLLAAGTHRIDQSSPFSQRWGGWYVTGTHTGMRHRGNLVIRESQSSRPEDIDNSAGQNLTDLTGRFDQRPYLSGHSDIVALLVLEHQADAHNYITRAHFEARQALHSEAALNRELNQPAGHRFASTESRLKNAAETLVRYLLFSGEAPLPGRVRGTSGFAEEYALRGPRDSQGRSLRDLDLETRLLKHPCSPLVYSPAFNALPDEMRRRVWHRLDEVLTAETVAPEFAHLSPADRQAIIEILQATHPHLPAGWGSAR